MKDMKTRIVPILLSFIAVMFLFAACGELGSQQEGEQAGASSQETAADVSQFDPEQVKTMGDFLAFASEENFHEAYTETEYVGAIPINGAWYRAAADMPEDVSEAVWAVDFEDPDNDDFDFYEEFKDLTVKSVTFDRIGDPAWISN